MVTIAINQPNRVRSGGRDESILFHSPEFLGFQIWQSVLRRKDFQCEMFELCRSRSGVLLQSATDYPTS